MIGGGFDYDDNNRMYTRIYPDMQSTGIYNVCFFLYDLKSRKNKN